MCRERKQLQPLAVRRSNKPNQVRGIVVPVVVIVVLQDADFDV